MKNNLFILFVLLLSFFFSQEREFITKEFKENGNIDTLVDDYSEKNYLVQLDIKNDSLLNHISSILPDLELYSGPSTYHRIMNENSYLRIAEILDKDFYHVLDQDYSPPQSREYWTLTLQGNQYAESSGEVNSSCMCLDNSSNCAVVGYNDSWYNPFDYYGEATWSFPPPLSDQFLEVRMYVAGVQCDDFPLSSETNLSIKNNSCSWSNFQVTLSESNTVNGPYIITDGTINDILCNGTFQPVIGSEDNYNVDYIQMELYYICEPANPMQNLNASDQEFCDYVNLSWAPNESAQSYNLYRDGNFITNLSPGENQFIDYFSEIGVEHEYCISAINECGESTYMCNMGSRKNVPESANNIYASFEYLNEIVVEWNPTDNTDYYYLYRDGSLLTIIPNGQSLYYQDVFVEQNVTYEYCVESSNDCGASLLSCTQGLLAPGSVGDVNLDSYIDVLDIVILINFVLELEVPTDEQHWLSDMNSDSILNILDVVLMVDTVFLSP
mgnify:CR=1 FL=1